MRRFKWIGWNLQKIAAHALSAEEVEAAFRRCRFVHRVVRPRDCNRFLEEALVTAAVQQLLESFDALSEGDKHRAAVEILRRASPTADADVPQSALIEAADELFRALDAEEAADAQR